MDPSQFVYLDRSPNGEDVDIIEEYEMDIVHFRPTCDQCGGHPHMEYCGEGDIPTVVDGRILHWTYHLRYECPWCDNEESYPMYTWRWRPDRHGPRYRSDLQDSSKPGFMSWRARSHLETSEEATDRTGMFEGFNELHVFAAGGQRGPNLNAREIEDLLDILKSYRDEPDKWGGIHEINDNLEFVIRAEGAFLRAFGQASQYIDDKELEKLIDKVQWTTCRCCGRRIRRTRLLKLHEKREEWRGNTYG